MKPNPSSKSPILRIKSSLWSIVYKNPPSKSLESPENYFKIHTITKGLYGQNQAESNLDPRYYNLDKNRNFVDKIISINFNLSLSVRSVYRLMQPSKTKAPVFAD